MFHYKTRSPIRLGSPQYAEYPLNAPYFYISAEIEKSRKSMENGNQEVDSEELSASYWGFICESFSVRGDLVGVLGDFTGSMVEGIAVKGRNVVALLQERHFKPIVDRTETMKTVKCGVKIPCFQNHDEGCFLPADEFLSTKRICHNCNLFYHPYCALRTLKEWKKDKRFAADIAKKLKDNEIDEEEVEGELRDMNRDHIVGKMACYWGLKQEMVPRMIFRISSVPILVLQNIASPEV